MKAFPTRLRKYLRDDMRLASRFALFAVILIIFPVTLLSAVFLSNMIQASRQALKDSHQQVAHQYAQRLEGRIKTYLSIMDTIAVSGKIQEILGRQRELNRSDTVAVSRAVAREIDNQIFIKKSREIFNIMLYAQAPEFPTDALHISSVARVEEEAWYRDLLSAPRPYHVHHREIPAIGESLLSLTKAIPNLASGTFSRSLGWIKMDLDAGEFFSEGMRNTKPRGFDVRVYDRSERVFFSDAVHLSDQTDAAFGGLQADDWVHWIADGQLKIVLSFPPSALDERVHAMVGFGLMLALTLILTTGFLVFVFSRFFSRRTEQLIQKISDYQKGNLEDVRPLGGKDEIGVIDACLSDLMREVSEKMRESYIHQISKRDAELRSLQFQVNPHFLYNTLETISSMGSVYGHEDICHISSRLGQMLHYNLNKEAAQVALLQDEIKHLENYVYIQRVRYGDAFTVHMCIPPELSKHKVLRFMLQPIVENSLLHGFVGPHNGYQLSIDAALENGKLIILVTDNGAGLSPDDLDALTQAFRNPGQYDVTRQQGIGLRNVNTRIKLTFGSEYGLAITSQPGVRTQVRITLPVLVEEGEWDVSLAGD